MSNLDWAYLAGWIDGEGSIRISRQKRNLGFSYKVTFSLATTDFSTLQWAQQLLSFGTINRKKLRKRCKQQWVWQVHSQQAMLLFKKILPHLKFRKRRAILAIHFQKLRNHTNQRLSRSEKKWQERYFDLFKKLNKRGR